MVNWTKEDVEFICTNIVQPALEATIKGIAEATEKSEEITDKFLKIIGDAIQEIRYEQERDRRFYKSLLTQALYMNEASYDNVYKSWCEEFDKLNKEKIICEKK